MKKIRKPISIFLSFLMMISMTFGMSFSAYADGFEYTYDENTRTFYINGTGETNENDMYEYLGDDAYDVITEEAQRAVVGEGITKISNNFFRSFSALEAVELSSTVEEIGQSAFQDTVLRQINLENVKVIVSKAFYGSSVTDVDLSNVQKIGWYAFYKTTVKSVVANNCDLIEDSAFKNCFDLESVETSAKTIEQSAFENDSKLESIKLTDAQSIGEMAFRGCTALTNVVLPSTLTLLDQMSFANCTQLRSVEIKDGAQTVFKDAVFSNVPDLISIYIPESVTDISSGTFDYDCRQKVCIIAPYDSYAYNYAKNNSIKCNTKGGRVWVKFVSGTVEDTVVIYDVGSTYGEMPKVSKDNYVFLGWQDENGNMISSSELVNPVDHTLTAVFKGNQFTITFDLLSYSATLNGDDTKTVNYMEECGTLPTPTLVGSVFVGWFDADGNEVTSKTVYTYLEDITLTPKFNAVSYKLELILCVNGDNTIYKTYELGYDEEFALPKSETIVPYNYKGHAFLGWTNRSNNNTYSDGEVVKNLAEKSNQTVVLYGYWQSYADINIGETRDVSIRMEGKRPSDHDFKFTVTEADQYLVKASGCKMTLTLKDSSDSVIATNDNFETGSLAKVIAKLEPGVYTAHISTSVVPCKYSITVAHTETATVLFSANGGKVDKTNMLVATGDEFGTMPIPTRDGYDFEGWADENSNIVTNLDIVPIGAKIINLKAVWTPVKYTFIYYSSSGAKLKTQAISYGTSEKLLSSKELGLYNAKPGYDFVGWSTAINSTAVAYSDEQEINNNFTTYKTVSLYPVYIKNHSKAVIYYYVNGEVAANQVVNNNSSATLNTVSSMQLSVLGYTIDGWSTTQQGEVEYTDGAQINVVAATEQVNLYAVLSPIKYNVEYYNSDGELLSTRRYISYDYEFKIRNYVELGGDVDDNMMCAGWATTQGSTTVEYKQNTAYKNLSSEQGAVIKLYPVIKSAESFQLKYALSDSQVFTDTGYYNERNYIVKSPLELTDLYSKEFLDKYFYGWTVDPNPPSMPDFFIGSKISSNDFKEADDVVLYAVWSEDFVPNDNTVIITVEKSTMGTTSLNGTDTTSGKSVEVERNSQITLKATANEGYEFVGWKLGGSLVSTDEEIVVKADKYVTYVPVFEEISDEEFTVVFIDMYGNVLSSQSVTSGADIVIPYIPLYPGYAFDSWSINENEIKKLKEGATIRANYKKDNSKTYFVKADGAAITVGGKTYQNEATGISYDTKVTVSKAGATSWRVGNLVIAYGESYSFYIGSNMELEAVKDDNESVKTQVAIVSTDRPSSQAPDVLFVGSRIIAPGEVIVRQGFIYGKNVTEQDLVLENVGKTASGANPGTVKVAYNKNGSAQIGLNYGLKAMSGSIGARAFVETKDASGNVKITYSNASMYTY